MFWASHAGPSAAATIDWALYFIQPLVGRFGLVHQGHVLALWLFFAACGVLELCIGILICTPVEHLWPLTSWPERNPIAADVAYALFVRVVLFPLVTYFEFSWLRQQLDGFLGRSRRESS